MTPNAGAGAVRVGQAALPFPVREGSFERRACLVCAAGALEHGGEVFVRVGLEKEVVRLGFRGGDRRPRERFRQLELAAR